MILLLAHRAVHTASAVTLEPLSHFSFDALQRLGSL